MNNDKHQHGNGKHMVLMLLCCLIPIALFAGIRYFNIGTNGLGRYSGILFLLCPLMHIFMMKGMMGHGKDNCHGDKKQDDEIKLEDSNR